MGFSQSVRNCEPYGLAEWCLEPGKVITDPIHGDVFVTKLEQLGTTHLVYPGATHTRLPHSLGAVRVVQTLLDYVVDQQNRLQPSADLFSEWEVDDEVETRLAATAAWDRAR